MGLFNVGNSNLAPIALMGLGSSLVQGEQQGVNAGIQRQLAGYNAQTDRLLKNAQANYYNGRNQTAQNVATIRGTALQNGDRIKADGSIERADTNGRYQVVDHLINSGDLNTMPGVIQDATGNFIYQAANGGGMSPRVNTPLTPLDAGVVPLPGTPSAPPAATPTGLGSATPAPSSSTGATGPIDTGFAASIAPPIPANAAPPPMPSAAPPMPGVGQPANSGGGASPVPMAPPIPPALPLPPSAQMLTPQQLSGAANPAAALRTRNSVMVNSLDSAPPALAPPLAPGTPQMSNASPVPLPGSPGSPLQPDDNRPGHFVFAPGVKQQLATTRQQNANNYGVNAQANQENANTRQAQEATTDLTNILLPWSEKGGDSGTAIGALANYDRTHGTNYLGMLTSPGPNGTYNLLIKPGAGLQSQIYQRLATGNYLNAQASQSVPARAALDTALANSNAPGGALDYEHRTAGDLSAIRATDDPLRVQNETTNANAKLSAADIAAGRYDQYLDTLKQQGLSRNATLQRYLGLPRVAPNTDPSISGGNPVGTAYYPDPTDPTGKKMIYITPQQLRTYADEQGSIQQRNQLLDQRMNDLRARPGGVGGVRPAGLAPMPVTPPSGAPNPYANLTPAQRQALYQQQLSGR